MSGGIPCQRGGGGRKTGEVVPIKLTAFIIWPFPNKISLHFQALSRLFDIYTNGCSDPFRERGYIKKETPRTGSKRRCYNYQSTSETANLVKLCAGYNVHLANKSYIVSKSVVLKFIVIDKAEEVRRWSDLLIEIHSLLLTTNYHHVPHMASFFPLLQDRNYS